MFVNSIDEVRKVVPINALTSFDTISPYLIKAEKYFLLPILGDNFYNEALNLQEDENLHEKIRECVVNYAFYDGFDMLNVQYDDTGFRRSSKEIALYRYQENNLKNKFKDDAYNSLESLLEFLQRKIDVYTEFKDSIYYLESKGSLFPSTMSFFTVCPISSSRLVFLKVASMFQRAIDFDIIPILGKDLFNEVINELTQDGGNANVLELLPYIRKALAYSSVAKGLLEFGMSFTEKGLLVESQNISVSNTEAPSAEKLDVIYRHYSSTADSYKAMLLEYLRDNAIRYPAFLQTNQTNINPFSRSNGGKKTVWL
jgi:hypothetical protein